MNIYEAVEQFITSLKKNHYSPLTISSYDLTIKEFIKFSKLEKAEQLSRAILAPYKEHINENEKRSSKTKNLKLIPVRRFIQFLNDQEITDVSYDVLSLVRSKNGRQPLDLISHEELKTFLEYKDTPKNDFLVNLLYYTGLRVAELRALNIQDIKNEFKICGKGGRTRIIFINPKVMKMFNIYKPGLEYIFITFTCMHVCMYIQHSHVCMYVLHMYVYTTFTCMYVCMYIQHSHA
jgi:site-specific recombinase XerD